MLAGVRERALDALARYGERAYVVLEAALRIADMSRQRMRLGDFDYKSIVDELKRMNIDYNPSMLLRSLEREYAIIETTYRSGSRHYWRFIDKEAVREALAIYKHGAPYFSEPEDPRIMLYKSQVAALEPARILEILSELSAKPRLSEADKRMYRRIAFNEAEKAVKIMRKIEMDGLEKELAAELELLRKIVEGTYQLSKKLSRSPSARLEPLTAKIRGLDLTAGNPA